MTEVHFEKCTYYILDCPNGCVAHFERGDLEDHMKMCGQQKVQCEFSYAGCATEFLRDKQKEHMEQNTQEHLALIAATLKINQEQQQANKQKLQEQKQAFEQGKNRLITITIVLISLSVLIIAIQRGPGDQKIVPVENGNCENIQVVVNEVQTMKRETESSIEAMESQTENNINALKIESTKIIGMQEEIIALKIESTKIIDMQEEIIALKKKIDTPVTTQKRKANNERGWIKMLWPPNWFSDD